MIELTPSPLYTPCMSLRPLFASARDVLEGYYRRRPAAARGPAPKGTIPYGLDGYYDEKGRNEIARFLTKHDEVKVWDPSQILLKLDIGAWLLNWLDSYFTGGVENYAEMNADEDDPAKQRHNADMQTRFHEASKAWAKSKVVIKKEPNNVVSITFSPSFTSIVKKFRAQ